MDTSHSVPDPSDWLGTSIPKLASVEAALRCQVCKDFYDTPMITSCSHTFCARCIRRCLTNDGQCPACRTPDQQQRLRNNWALQELVEAFQNLRPSLLQLGQDTKKAGTSHSKRKQETLDLDEDDQSAVESHHRPNTRSQRRKVSSSHHQSHDEIAGEGDPTFQGEIYQFSRMQSLC